MKARAISNVSEFYKVVNVEELKSQSLEESLLQVNKVKYNLGLVYFVALAVLLTTLFI
ncbi:MAG: hypothetical protein HYS24_08935 [Ignavibacteriales bacterium]|nr:hypothetical protein [Ignavibacteriales bacterium]